MPPGGGFRNLYLRPLTQKISSSRRVKALLLLFCGFNIMYLALKQNGRTPQRPLDYMPPEMIEYVAKQEQLPAGSPLSHALRRRAPYKLLLLATPFFGSSTWYRKMGTGWFSTCAGQASRCVVTDDQRLAPLSDGLLFHIEEIRPRPPRRYAGQRWFMYSMESPIALKLRALSVISPNWRDMFNYTLTYRLDSDIPTPYGKISRKSKQDKANKNYHEITKKKSRLMSWVVSNCYAESLRLAYADELKKHIPLDMYGRCGNLNCPRDPPGKCKSMINETYKFYFVAENSFCEQYASEKLFSMFPLDVVLVVRGGANYSQILPSGTYINTMDFKSVKKLADYLLYLDKHPEEYIKYLKRKDRYEVSFRDVWCDICKNLNTENVSTQYYRDIHKWWGEQGCTVAPPDRKQFSQSTLDRFMRYVENSIHENSLYIAYLFRSMFTFA